MLNVIEPDREFLIRVIEEAKRSGDLGSLSKSDLKLLALALQLQEEGLEPFLVTDDYTVQNLASRFKIRWLSVKTRGIERRVKWHYRCTACGRVYYEYMEGCPVCGHKLKRGIAGYEDL